MGSGYKLSSGQRNQLLLSWGEVRWASQAQVHGFNLPIHTMVSLSLILFSLEDFPLCSVCISSPKPLSLEAGAGIRNTRIRLCTNPAALARVCFTVCSLDRCRGRPICAFLRLLGSRHGGVRIFLRKHVISMKITCVEARILERGKTSGRPAPEWAACSG